MSLSEQLSESGGTAVDSPARLSEDLSRIRLIATSDLHGQLLSYDYFANRNVFGSGLAQIACLIREAREETPVSLLFDNGDFLQGSALVEPPSVGLRRASGLHPATAAFNALGYDAVALGNHEFDFGLPHLRAAMRGAEFPFLSANILLSRGESPAGDESVAAPYAMIRRELCSAGGVSRTITIAVLGLTPPETLRWNHRLLPAGIEARPMEEAARAWVPELRRRGADLVICLAHTGVPAAGQPAHDEALAARIAAIDGVDAVIAGHTHLVYPDPRALRLQGMRPGHILGKPVVQPGQQGNALGLIDLWLRHGRDGWQVAGSEARVMMASENIAGQPAQSLRSAAAPLRKALARDHRAALSSMRVELGQSPVALTSYFALIAPSQALQLIGAAKIAHIRSRLAGGGQEGLPVVAFVNAFRSGGRGGPQHYTAIAPGALTMRNVYDLYPFANTITAEQVTGLELMLRLERGMGLYRRIQPGLRDQPLADAAVPGFSLPVAIGLSYQIDLSRPPLSGPGAGPISTDALIAGRGRIRRLQINGRAVAPEDRLILASNSYQIGLRNRSPAHLLLDEGTRCSDIIAGFIRAGASRGSEARAAAEGEGWSFAPMPGTSVLFESGSGALAQLAGISHFRPEVLGLSETGFYRFRLHL